jgi:DNA-binding CsgD family transcriptional regulator/PAS domain-containing protein
MDRRDELLRLVRRAYQASTDSTKWPGFLGWLSAFFGGTVTGFQHYGPDPRSARPDFVGMDPAHDAAYRSHYAALNPWIKRGYPLYEPGRVLASDAYVPLSELRQTEFYNDFLRDVGVGHAFGACLFKRDGVLSHFTVTRSERGGPFRPHELAEARALLPHVRQAVQIHDTLGDLRDIQRALGDVLERMTHGVFVIDARGHVLFVNKAGRSIARQRDGLALVSDGLEACVSSERLKLRTLISRAVTASKGGTLRATTALSISRPSMKQPLSVLVTPLRLSVDQGDVPAATVFVSDPERMQDPDMRGAQAAYGLSPAEARVAAALAASESIQRAADRLCLSRDTARWHLKRIYRKTSTTRQPDLVKLILSSSMR